MPAWVYILECSDGSYYTGSTTQGDPRIATHTLGQGGAYTSKRLPVRLVFADQFPFLDQAFLAERQIKGWRRAKKEALIRRDYDSLRQLPRTAKDRGPRILRQAQDGGQAGPNDAVF